MKNVLVFPCGSEIALEIHRALKNSIHFNLIGASSVDDHGKFVYKNYIANVPFVNAPNFISAIAEIVKKYDIDFIYPAMDSVATKLKIYECELNCAVIASPSETTEICLDKEKTYERFKNIIRTPDIYSADAKDFPVFCKPKIGYGSRGTKKISDDDMLREHLKEYPNSLILEYLPGEEYTTDCFTDRNGRLLFCGPRVRRRISNGISVNTAPVEDNGEFRLLAEKINANMKLRGAWFAQFKRAADGELVLLEIASRLGGSSAVHRARGINFAQLSLFDAMGIDVEIIDNHYKTETDRSLNSSYRIDVDYDEVFIDYDDTIILKEKYYNTDVMKLLYQCKNRGIKISLLSSHSGDLNECLEKFQLKQLFDRVIHISKNNNKADYIDNKKSIFIDDSFAERKRVYKKTGIPVFSVDMIEMLLED